MARGWESKDVEEQMDARERLRSPAPKPPDPAQLKANQERESLELSRTRVLQDLAVAKNQNYRALLQRSLAYLDERIAALAPK